MPFEGKRIAMPIDAPIVYGYEEAEVTIIGGKGQDLADQLYDVLTKKLNLTIEQFQFSKVVLSMLLSSY